MKTVKVSKYNEIDVRDAINKGYITSSHQIIKGAINKGGFSSYITSVIVDNGKKEVAIYTNDDIKIDNIIFTPAKASDNYFTKEISF